MRCRRPPRPAPRPTTTAVAASAGALLLLLAGCSSTDVAPQDLPVAVGEPVDDDSTEASGGASVGPAQPRTSPTPEVAASTGAAVEDDVPDVVDAPSAADAASFVEEDVLLGATGLDHVLVDLDGDDVPEVVATAVVDGEVALRIAWWDSGGYRVLADDVAGPAVAVGQLRAADLNADGATELLLELPVGATANLAVWSVPGRGALLRQRAVGGCHDGSHVYGVTGAHLETGADGLPVIVASCDDSPLPVADWSQQRYQWQDGAYRPVLAAGDRPAGAEGDRPEEADS